MKDQLPIPGKRQYSFRVDYKVGEDGILEIKLGDTAYAAFSIPHRRLPLSFKTLAFLAIVRARTWLEVDKSLIEMELTVNELYENLEGFSLFHKELHKRVGAVNACIGIVLH